MKFVEEEQVYAIQCGLHAIKPCEMCGTWLCVTEFGGYRCQPCEECVAEQERLKRHAGYVRTANGRLVRVQPRKLVAARLSHI